MKRKLSARIFLTGLELMKPILVPIFWALGKAYNVLFGPSDLRSSHSSEEQLRQKIRENLSFLFDEYGARIESDQTLPHARPFDYAVVITSIQGLAFRFIRGRGEFTVQVSPTRIPLVWEDLTLVLNIIDPAFQQRDFSSFAASLREAFSAGESELQRRLSDAHIHERVVIRQRENEINRRLYNILRISRIVVATISSIRVRPRIRLAVQLT